MGGRNSAKTFLIIRFINISHNVTNYFPNKKKASYRIEHDPGSSSLGGCVITTGSGSGHGRVVPLTRGVRSSRRQLN